jgi:HlyD family secretion protein
MRKRRWTILGYLLVMALVLGAIAYSFVPTPVAVETRQVVRGSLQVTVEDDGKTRIKEKYVISSPLSGRLARVQLNAGDAVEADDTILTTLDPTAPTLLDARARAEAEARLKAAEAAYQRSEPTLQMARQEADLAAEEYERAEQLYLRKSISHEERDRAEHRMRNAREALRVAEFAAQVARYEWELAQAALIHTHRASDHGGVQADADPDEWRVVFRSPIDGRVLRVLQESSTIVSAGTPLMEVGDPRDLEVVVDVLSSDAVKIRPGDHVVLENWGGPEPLDAHVRYVEPSGFTKISALGVEEQRVNVIIDLDTPPAERATLGDDYRVEARIVVDQAVNVVKVPNGALFRHGRSMAVFVVEDGRAEIRPLTTGRRSRLETEVVAGLVPNQLVVVYPSDKVHDGVRVTTQ